ALPGRRLRVLPKAEVLRPSGAARQGYSPGTPRRLLLLLRQQMLSGDLGTAPAQDCRPDEARPAAHLGRQRPGAAAGSLVGAALVPVPLSSLDTCLINSSQEIRFATASVAACWPPWELGTTRRRGFLPRRGRMPVAGATYPRLPRRERY